MKKAPAGQVSRHSMPIRVLLLLLVLLQTGLARAEQPFAKEIAAFTAADQTNPPPQHAVLFIGSSSIRRWTTLARDFPNHQVINRGFGGSQISDSVYYFDTIVAPYHPRVIVLYAGSNDINAGKTPEQVLEDFKAFARAVHRTLPETRLFFISIGTSPSRWRQVEKVREANRLIRACIAHDDKLGFIDVFPAMLGTDGKPKPDIFVSDRLHLNAKGYAIWKSLIAPHLEEAPLTK
jgi:lysophospholipase L1-like esterase